MSLFCRTLFLYPHLTILIISDLWSYYHPPKNFPYLSLSAFFLLFSYFVAPVLLLIFLFILYIPALFLPFLSQFLFFLLIVFSPYLSYFYFPSFQFISLPLAVFPQKVQLPLTHFYWLCLPFLSHIVFVQPSVFFLSALMNKPFLRPVSFFLTHFLSAVMHFFAFFRPFLFFWYSYRTVLLLCFMRFLKPFFRFFR